MSEERRREWLRLYRRIKTVLKQYGKADYWTKDGFHVADYLLVDDDWGNQSHKVEIHSLHMLQPTVMKSLQGLLRDFPNWDIFVQVDVPGTEDTWPRMSLFIGKDHIYDVLERKHFPPEYQSLAYEGAIPLGSKEEIAAWSVELERLEREVLDEPPDQGNS